MKKILCFVIASCFLSGCSDTITAVIEKTPPVTTQTMGTEGQVLEEPIKEEQAQGETSVEITVNQRVFTAVFYDTPTANALVSHMPFTVDMKEFAAQEKVGTLVYTLPDEESQTPDTVETGGLYLWSGNQMVLFYKTFSNNYAYVPLGQIQEVDGLREALGSGDVTIGFAVKE